MSAEEKSKVEGLVSALEAAEPRLISIRRGQIAVAVSALIKRLLICGDSRAVPPVAMMEGQ